MNGTLAFPPSANIRYLAIEGVIGVGKSSLAKIVAQRADARLMQEQFEENPFLSKFYQDRKAYAFQTQLFFLLSRHRQFAEQFAQQDLFHPFTVTDHTFDKDRIIARATLDDAEMALYSRVADVLERDVARPDFVVYLQADVEVLMQRIRKRGRHMERDIDPGYLRELIALYNEHFFRYRECPVLIVNTNNIDFVENNDDLEMLLERIRQVPPGISAFIPESR